MEVCHTNLFQNLNKYINIHKRDVDTYILHEPKGRSMCHRGRRGFAQNAFYKSAKLSIKRFCKKVHIFSIQQFQDPVKVTHFQKRLNFEKYGNCLFAFLAVCCQGCCWKRIFELQGISTANDKGRVPRQTDVRWFQDLRKRCQEISPTSSKDKAFLHALFVQISVFNTFNLEKTVDKI